MKKAWEIAIHTGIQCKVVEITESLVELLSYLVHLFSFLVLFLLRSRFFFFFLLIWPQAQTFFRQQTHEKRELAERTEVSTKMSEQKVILPYLLHCSGFSWCVVCRQTTKRAKTWSKQEDILRLVGAAMEHDRRVSHTLSLLLCVPWHNSWMGTCHSCLCEREKRQGDSLIKKKIFRWGTDQEQKSCPANAILREFPCCYVCFDCACISTRISARIAKQDLFYYSKYNQR